MRLCYVVIVTYFDGMNWKLLIYYSRVTNYATSWISIYSTPVDIDVATDR